MDWLFPVLSTRLQSWLHWMCLISTMRCDVPLFEGHPLPIFVTILWHYTNFPLSSQIIVNFLLKLNMQWIYTNCIFTFLIIIIIDNCCSVLFFFKPSEVLSGYFELGGKKSFFKFNFIVTIRALCNPFYFFPNSVLFFQISFYFFPNAFVFHLNVSGFWINFLHSILIIYVITF